MRFLLTFFGIIRERGFPVTRITSITSALFNSSPQSCGVFQTAIIPGILLPTATSSLFNFESINEFAIMWRPIYPLFVLFLNYNFVLSTTLPFEDRQLYEGSKCRLKNGTEGICTKTTKCAEKMQQIRDSDYTAENRCGFDNFDEITCCATTQSSRRYETEGLRPADAACNNYKKLWETVSADGYTYVAVFNGVLAKKGEFPHMAALGYPASEEEAIGGVKYICGGTLISEKHVLTAAHCVSNVNEFVPVEVKLGTIDLEDVNSRTIQRIPISRIIEHPDHKQSLNYHDVAILELQHPVNLTIDVYPTCLMTESLTRGGKPYTNFSFLVLGWGAISLDGTTSTKLLKADQLTYVERPICHQSYKNLRAKIPNGLDDGMICVSDPDTTRNADTCWGDSGGPLQISTTPLPPLVGITSFGQACGTGTPAVYASVYKYLQWIEDQVWPK